MEAISKKEHPHSRCRYVSDGATLVAVTSLLALVFFSLARCNAVDKRPYIFCLIGSLGAFVLSASHHRASYISRVFPLAAYGSYTAISALAYFAGLTCIGSKDIPLLAVHTIRMISVAIMVFHLVLNGGRKYPLWEGRRYWFATKLSLFASPLLDILLLGTAFCLPYEPVLGGIAFFELLTRAIAEFWFAIACLTLIQPYSVTINYSKIRKLVKSFLISIVAGVFIRICTCSTLSDEIPAQYFINSAFFMGLTCFIGACELSAIIRNFRYKSPQIRDCLHEFSNSRWFFTSEELKGVSDILLKLEYISQEKQKVQSQPKTAFHIGKLQFLQGEEEDLLIELDVKYHVNVSCQAESPHKKRKTSGKK